MSDLFSQPDTTKAPLALRLRPKELEDFVGQKHLIGPGQFLTEILKNKDFMPSLIFWGPPGCGKTTLAHLLSQKKNCRFEHLSAVTSGIKDVKEIVKSAKDHLKFNQQKTILFLDEIHRFNKAQQDALLPHIEDGTLILIGATTENPSFEIIAALLSRLKVVVIHPLEENDLNEITERALTDTQNGLGNKKLKLTDDAKKFLFASSDGDARRLLNTLEIASQLTITKEITDKHIEQALQKRVLPHDKKGEEHYNLISAFIKSMRGSDPDAAIYYLARLIEAGEDPLFIVRRMVILASEDIGNANPQAISVAIACQQSVHFIGMPEGWIPMAQCATYLACSPKSNASYMAYKKAKKAIYEYGPLNVPMQIRNAPTKLMKELGYSQGYEYAHDQKDYKVSHDHLPDKIKDLVFYEPTENGMEAKLKDWLDKIRKNNN